MTETQKDWGPLSMSESGRPILEKKEIEIKNVPQSITIQLLFVLAFFFVSFFDEKH